MYGTPVLASNLGGTPELIEEGVTGESFEAGNSKALKEKINSLWENPDKCEEYAKNCGKISFDTVETYCEKLLTIYKGEWNEGK